MLEDIRHGMDANEALKKNTGSYGRYAEGVKSVSYTHLFRKTRKISADVQAYFKRNLTPYSGSSASIFGEVEQQWIIYAGGTLAVALSLGWKSCCLIPLHKAPHPA